jgi:hypothetical protein
LHRVRPHERIALPYIEPGKRESLNSGSRSPETAGELNYCITRLCDDYLQHQLSYERINAAVGALECAKMELYRRVAVAYENAKITANGDVYTVPTAS